MKWISFRNILLILSHLRSFLLIFLLKKNWEIQFFERRTLFFQKIKWVENIVKKNRRRFSIVVYLTTLICSWLQICFICGNSKNLVDWSLHLERSWQYLYKGALHALICLKLQSKQLRNLQLQNKTKKYAVPKRLHIRNACGSFLHYFTTSVISTLSLRCWMWYQQKSSHLSTTIFQSGHST